MRNRALFDEVFYPQLTLIRSSPSGLPSWQSISTPLRFIGFLKQDVQFGAELGIGSGSGSFPGVGRHGSSGPQKLFSNDPNFIPRFWQQNEKANHS
jgi:hypothetical protein